MSKNTGLEKLRGEFAALAEALGCASLSCDDKAVILARLVTGLSSEDWQEIRQSSQVEQWHAFPVESYMFSTEEQPTCGANLPISPFREVRGALTTGIFMAALDSELLRISRNGGCLSLISAALADRRGLATALGEGAVLRLEDLLGTALLSQLESCDALGILGPGSYICCLPGLGQLGARNFAEKAQCAFEDDARPFFPTGGISAGKGASCAIGIVNLMTGETGNVKDLIRRARLTLDVALTKNGRHIHQESTFTPLDGATLVQSSEKRFLFFGGDEP